MTRNANVEMNEEVANDLLEMIETELRERHFAEVVRLEVEAGMNPCTGACWRQSWGSMKTRMSTTLMA